ncbi:MAG: bis(5'-nucleosyl)-tetraphosphatase (symmetrical) YqeK [Clostridia bacterium]|nr:bis(5'-nucleosyl)-tetraphosphatase (symmetrical) YqeK [Clostridia bacterium]
MSIQYESVISAIAEVLPQFISGKRLAHTLAVERECRSLTALFTAHPLLMSEEDGYKLRIAALLHDITKEKTPAEHAALAEKYRIPLTDLEKSAPKVLHSKTAPSLAREIFNVQFGACVVDDAICDAIRTHTTGAANMSLIGKLLYLADYIEDTRTFEDCVALRHAFYDTIDAHQSDAASLMHHLDNTLLLSFDMTIRDLLESGAPIDENTTAARNALLFSAIRP